MVVLVETVVAIFILRSRILATRPVAVQATRISYRVHSREPFI